jgi:hypothetical protein
MRNEVLMKEPWGGYRAIVGKGTYAKMQGTLFSAIVSI